LGQAQRRMEVFALLRPAGRREQALMTVGSLYGQADQKKKQTEKRGHERLRAGAQGAHSRQGRDGCREAQKVLFRAHPGSSRMRDFSDSRGSPVLANIIDDLVARGWSLQPGFISQSLTTDRKSTRLNSSHVKISYAVF